MVMDNETRENILQAIELLSKVNYKHGVIPHMTIVNVQNVIGDLQGILVR